VFSYQAPFKAEILEAKDAKYSVSIFEGFEPESDDEDDEEQDGAEESEAEAEEESGLTEEGRERIEKLAIQDFPDDEPFEPTPSSDSEDAGTGIQTSQLRHFVIQVSSDQGGDNRITSLIHLWPGICSTADISGSARDCSREFF
jgi:hypothetical protein